MIQTKQQLKDWIARDAIACGRKGLRPSLLGDEIWKFQLAMRRLDYYQTRRLVPLWMFWRLRYHRLSVKLGFTIPCDVFGPGLSIVHYGPIAVHNNARIGENCRVHEGVTIGATNGSSGAPRLGRNVFIGSGAKIIGDITVADDVAIGANAVVVRSITQPGTTWAGIPARKVSENDSHANLNRNLFG